MRISHKFYYFLEVLILTVGFYIVYLLSYNLRLQALALIILLIFYSGFGIVHHKIHHDLKKKIVVEYILISLIILSIFLFLNIGKI